MRSTPLTSLTLSMALSLGLAAAPATQPASRPTTSPAHGHLTYKLAAGNDKWDPEKRKQIIQAMDAALAIYNAHSDLNRTLIANYSPGTPTADANYNGWINFGGQIGRRTAMHEIAHTLGIGTHPGWSHFAKDGKWTGPAAISQLKAFDGPNATLHCDHQHFWPYGLNYDNESSPTNDVRHVRMVLAFRKDLGIKD